MSSICVATLLLQPEMWDALEQRGEVLLSQGLLDEAILDFNHVLRFIPKRALAYGNRGLAFLLQGKELQAQQDFDRCLSINPAMASELKLHIQKARSLMQLHLKRSDAP